MDAEYATSLLAICAAGRLVTPAARAAMSSALAQYESFELEVSDLLDRTDGLSDAAERERRARIAHAAPTAAIAWNAGEVHSSDTDILGDRLDDRIAEAFAGAWGLLRAPRRRDITNGFVGVRAAHPEEPVRDAADEIISCLATHVPIA